MAACVLVLAGGCEGSDEAAGAGLITDAATDTSESPSDAGADTSSSSDGDATQHQEASADAALDSDSDDAHDGSFDAADASHEDAQSLDADEPDAADASISDAASSDAADATTPWDWSAGAFRYLPAMQGDLVTFVDGLEHPNNGGYGKVSSSRAGRFRSFVVALMSAIEQLQAGSDADWCDVLVAADDAGYELHRFFDTTVQRWFLYASDRTPYGQAYFVINPEPRRDLVIEAPHEPYDMNTAAEGAALFRQLAARALIINKEHRCSDPDATPCDGTTGACGGFYRESDVAHHTANTFQLLHIWYSDASSSTRFAQLHGMNSSSSDRAEVNDGTYNRNNPASVSIAFVNNLRKYVPNAQAVYSCQNGQTPQNLCGSTNVQGRYTNAPQNDVCTTGTTHHSGRFLHIEQGLTLRDDDESDGWSRGDIGNALVDTWPECSAGADGTCQLGPAQAWTPACTCGSGCPAVSD